MTSTERIIVEAENLISRYGPHGMSQWEWDFLNGISRAVRRGKWLTGNQKRVAKKLITDYAEKSATS